MKWLAQDVRKWRLIGTLALPIVLLASTACTTDRSVPPPACKAPVDMQAAIKGSWQPTLLPLKVTVASSGSITVDLVANWVTPLGTFGLSGGVSHHFPQQSDSHLLVLRSVRDGVWQETGYRITCNKEYRVFLNGKFTATVTAGRTTIAAEPDTESTMVVIDSAANVGPNLKPLPAYRPIKSAVVLEFPDPIGGYGLGADVDAGLVAEFGIGARDSDDQDIRNEFGTGLKRGSGGYLGWARHRNPTAEQCEEAAKGGRGLIKMEELAVGKIMCVITSAGNVAILKVTKLAPDKDPSRRAFTLRGSLWMKNST